MSDKRPAAAASPLVVTRNRVPCPDQRSALDEFAARCGHKVLFSSDVDRVRWAILSELHTNIPEDKRPMSWSDLSDEQAERMRRAACAAIDAIRPFSPFDERLRSALQGCMDAICYESEEAADKGKWALPFGVVIEAKKALADKRLPRVENEHCQKCFDRLEPHGACSQCGEYARDAASTKLIGIQERK